MSHLFANKVIAITGAASGIGLETAKLLSSRGAKLSLADVSEGPLQEVCASIESAGGTVIHSVLDVRDRIEVEDWITKTVDTYGRLDGAVNLAGVQPKQVGRAKLQEVDDGDFNRVLDVNVKGTLNCLRAQLKVMVRGAAIVNAASIFGLRGMKMNTAYVVSKHAIVGLTRAAAVENADKGIRVNAVAPGPTMTPMLPWKTEESDRIPWQRAGRPLEVAESIAWLLCDASSYTTGTAEVIDGGLISQA
ncbi:putative secondary metabolism biosynthetic enzyme [Knufia obscura]|uniref:Secondary metabolism biosynthetic enzyme n=2 Tax=Knufia TaxID=430999 RepID=A0AAN8E9E3_9EURO|nr:putative secondary metabolism biosynthetic enzyme [Knufia obscura]KAK5948978.1 putative secondary metabolism biosynthetic enzyme [Knufia fluminis]